MCGGLDGGELHSKSVDKIKEKPAKVSDLCLSGGVDSTVAQCGNKALRNDSIVSLLYG
jgi:NH3-dependent NAD+ synthetase